MGPSDALPMVTKDSQLIKSRLENCFKNRLDLISSMGFLVAQRVKNPAVMHGT